MVQRSYILGSQLSENGFAKKKSTLRRISKIALTMAGKVNYRALRKSFKNMARLRVWENLKLIRVAKVFANGSDFTIHIQRFVLGAWASRGDSIVTTRILSMTRCALSLFREWCNIFIVGIYDEET